MRFTLVGPVFPFRGGIAHYTTMLYRALQQRGHSVLLVSFKHQYPKWLFPGTSDRDPSLQPVRIDEARYWINSMNPLTWLSTFARIYRHKPDALILQWWSSFWAPLWICLGLLNRTFLCRPLLILCHNVLPHESRWWDPWLARLVLRQGSGFVVQSAEERERLVHFVPDAAVAIGMLPTYDQWPEQRLPQAEARRQLGLPLDVPVLLFFGLVRRYKGLEVALAALPEILQGAGPVNLVIAGEFWEGKQGCLDMIQELGVQGHVIVSDRYVPDEKVALYFSAADLVVAPYRSVTGSAVVQLAHAFALPVVTTRGIEFQMTEGERQLQIEPDDAAGLARAVIRYFREGLGQELRAEIMGRQEPLSWEGLAVTIESLSRQEGLPA
jgi:glycosyltransferase involved in cell wall biosynthesis